MVVGGLLGLLLRDHIVQHVECGIEPLLATGTDDDERPVTIEINVNYLEAREPGVLRTVANIRRRGSRFTVLEAEVLQDDRLIAFATGDRADLSTSDEQAAIVVNCPRYDVNIADPTVR